MRTLLAALLLVLPLAAQDRPRPIGEPPAKASSASPTTPVIPATGTDPEVATVLVYGQRGRGSGAVVHTDGKSSLILTNKHVVPVEGEYHIRHAGKTYPATRKGWAVDADLAVLSVNASLPALKLAASEPAADTIVRLYGYGGLPKRGAVIGRDGSMFADKGPAWRMTLIPEPGDSGSPVVNEAGELVALAWGFSGGRGMAVPLRECRTMINAHLPGAKPTPVQPAQPSPGVSFAPTFDPACLT